MWDLSHLWPVFEGKLSNYKNIISILPGMHVNHYKYIGILNEIAFVFCKFLELEKTLFQGEKRKGLLIDKDATMESFFDYSHTKKIYFIKITIILKKIRVPNLQIYFL